MEKIKAFLKTKKGIICLIAAAVILLAACGFGGYEIWHSQQVKFHDLTVELGTENIKLAQFMTEYARARNVSFVSDPSVVDLNTVGQTELVLAHGNSEETVILTVEDTTAPQAQFAESVTVHSDYIPHVSDFVTEVFDYSDTTVTFEEEVIIPSNYSDITVKIAVTDACGNKTVGESTLCFEWLREEVTLEYGDTLTKEDLLFMPEKDEGAVAQSAIDEINTSDVGQYIIKSKRGGKVLTCTVNVQDTVGPDLVLREVKLYVGRTTKEDAFIVSCEDLSGVKELRLVTEIDFTLNGKQTVIFEAEDIYGNITTKETALYISNDHTAPVFYGLTTMYPEKYTQPDYTEGVTASDRVDGEIEFTYDASSVDTSVAGTYYVTYTAKDASGNVVTSKRKVVVPHDQADTDAMVMRIAESLPDDPEIIRDYVRNNIYYSHAWGGDDPVWYGFVSRNGNCYVHALCLIELLEEKGYECELIWVTSKTHYWVIVNIDGTWWHIDATPGRRHSRYSLMTDEMRLETLSGRVWDTSLWPACGE